MLTFIDRIAAFALLVGLLIAAALVHRGTETISGIVRVVDGDTLALAGRRVRLLGMDAPELGQTCERSGTVFRCGEDARETLIRLVGGGEPTCQVSGRDRYGRDLARCAVGADDLGRAMVRSGMAVGEKDYLQEEQEARAERIGLWAGTFERPSTWRNAHRH